MEKEFKMLEATNKQEAIQSLIDVKENKPQLLPEDVRCKKGLFMKLQKMTFQEVRDIFIIVKTKYYDSIDYSNKF